MDVLDPSFGMTLWHVLAAATLLLAVLSAFRSSTIAAVLLANWAICTFLIRAPDSVTGIPHWLQYAGVDWLSAMAIAYVARSNAHLTIVFLLFATLFAHLTIGLYIGVFNTDQLPLIIQQDYWEFTHWTAWLEAWCLVAVLGARAHELCGSWVNSISDRRSIRKNAETMVCHQQGAPKAVGAIAEAGE